MAEWIRDAQLYAVGYAEELSVSIFPLVVHEIGCEQRGASVSYAYASPLVVYCAAYRDARHVEH